MNLNPPRRLTLTAAKAYQRTRFLLLGTEIECKIDCVCVYMCPQLCNMPYNVIITTSLSHI